MDNNNDKPGINEYGVPDNPESKLTGNEVFFDNKAKKMLSGKDITKMMLDTPVYGVENGEGVEYEFTNENRPKPQSQWNDPEMTGDIMGIKIIEDKLGVVGENEFKVLTPEQAEAYKRMVEIKNGLTPPIDTSMDIQNEKKWYDKEGDILDALQRVCDYCNEIGISPDQLINDHRETANANYSDFQ